MLCASIGERYPSDALRTLRSLPHRVPHAEIRLDLLDDPSPEPFCREAGPRLIITCRRRRDGGHFRGSEAERLSLLDRARKAGARFVDIEMDVEDRAVGSGRGVLRSYHDIRGTPRDLDDLARDLRAHSGEAWKLAVTAGSYRDALQVFDCLDHHRGAFTCLAMGAPGLATRVLGEGRGNFLTYCAARAEAETAPGQPTVTQMIHLYRAHALGPRPDVYGLVGSGITHSLSPQLHNAWFARRRERRIYLPFEATELGDFMSFARELPLAGWSVTTPFKEAIIGFLDSLAPSAKLAGCVNTVLARAGRLHGYNTDIRALRRLIGRRPGRVLVLGSGSTARAACGALADNGCAVTLTARRMERARAISDELDLRLIPWRKRGTIAAQVVVNATSVGHGGHSGIPLPESAMHPGQLVVDFPYGGNETDLVRSARANGCRVIDGRRILLEQARLQRDIFRRGGRESNRGEGR